MTRVHNDGKQYLDAISKSQLGNPHEDYGPIYPVVAETTTLASRFRGGVGF